MPPIYLSGWERRPGTMWQPSTPPKNAPDSSRDAYTRGRVAPRSRLAHTCLGAIIHHTYYYYQPLRRLRNAGSPPDHIKVVPGAAVKALSAFRASAQCGRRRGADTRMRSNTRPPVTRGGTKRGLPIGRTGRQQQVKRHPFRPYITRSLAGP